jgi:pimeloyl-ACP methyl ester carboxylesterase
MGKFGKLWKTVLATGAGAGLLAAVNASIRRSAGEPDDAVFGGAAQSFPWQHGDIFYKTAGPEEQAAPLLFVHGIGAGVSSFMWRRNFDELSRDYQVYAPDLLGCGLSAKPPYAYYSTELYVELIADFIRQVIGRPAHLVASSLGAAYCARVADQHPELVKDLLLISPTGVNNLRARPGMTGAAFYGLLESPVLGESFYNVVASERSIRDYARQQLFYEPSRATERLIGHYYAASHQPGAQHVIAAFLSGYLNTDIRAPFTRLRQRVTLVWGKQDETNKLEQAAELLHLNPQARLVIFDHCRMMPQEEHPERFNALAREALRRGSDDTTQD